MNKNIEKEYRKLCKLYDNQYVLSSKLKKMIEELVEFEVDITYCQGDGVLLLDPNSVNVCPFEVLKNKSKKNKLTYNEFEINTI